jgi:hypothetical protein
MPKPRLTVSAINNEIEKEFPHVKLARGEGYYYIYSDDHETGLRIADLYSTSIYVNQLRHLTLEQWVQEVRNLFDPEKNRSMTTNSAEDHGGS